MQVMSPCWSRECVT